MKRIIIIGVAAAAGLWIAAAGLRTCSPSTPPAPDYTVNCVTAFVKAGHEFEGMRGAELLPHGAEVATSGPPLILNCMGRGRDGEPAIVKAEVVCGSPMEMACTRPTMAYSGGRTRSRR